MSKIDIIRAWKDEEYRNSLNDEQQALLPANPAGQIELEQDELEMVDGASTWMMITAGCCDTGWWQCSVQTLVFGTLTCIY